MGHLNHVQVMLLPQRCHLLLQDHPVNGHFAGPSGSKGHSLEHQLFSGI
jgi:hypothetical protein